jgi:hypothetical protein
MLCSVGLVGMDISEEHSTSIIRVTRIGELGQFLQEPHSITFQNTAFLIVTAVKTSNLTQIVVV